MKFNYNRLTELILTLDKEFPSLHIELSGYIAPNGDYKILFGDKHHAPFLDKEISFHTHPTDTPPSPQDLKNFLVSSRMKSHIIITPKRVFVITVPKRKAYLSLILVKLQWFKGTLKQWKRIWKRYVVAANLIVVQYSKKEFC